MKITAQMAKPGPDREVSDDDILRAIRDAYAPAIGTSDVADAVGISRQRVDERLRELDELGYVNTQKAGTARIWWLSDEGKKRLAEH